MLGTGVVRTGAVTELLACESAGSITIAPHTGGGFDWSFTGLGSCLDPTLPPSATQSVTLAGTGTSATLGLCDSSVLVQNLALTVNLTLTNLTTGTVRRVTEGWGLSLTTFPVATPFTITGATGAGTIVSHILAQCPPMGTRSAYFAWAQSPA